MVDKVILSQVPFRSGNPTGKTLVRLLQPHLSEKGAHSPSLADLVDAQWVVCPVLLLFLKIIHLYFSSIQKGILGNIAETKQLFNEVHVIAFSVCVFVCLFLYFCKRAPDDETIFSKYGANGRMDG